MRCSEFQTAHFFWFNPVLGSCVPIKIFPPFQLIFLLPCAILIIEPPVGGLIFY